MWVDSFSLNADWEQIQRSSQKVNRYLKTSSKRKSLCVASNMPLDVNLEVPSCESCSLYHHVPSLKETEVQRQGKTKRVGFVAMEQALSLPHQKR